VPSLIILRATATSAVGTLPNGFSVFSRMLGVDMSVLRAISAPWVTDPDHAPTTLYEIVRLLEETKQPAGKLNNINAWKQATTGAFRLNKISARSNL